MKGFSYAVDAMPMRWCLSMLILGLAPLPSRAHNLGADFKQVGERIEVEAFFSDNTPARQARVQILDGEKNILGTATTDNQGKCWLPAPNPGQYQLLVNAGDGHRKELMMTIVGTLPVAPDADPATPGNSPLSFGGREEFTRFPWERVAVGCGVIALVGAAWWWSRRAAS